MTRFKLLLIVALLARLASVFAYRRDTVAPEDASRFTGRPNVVCGTIVATHHATRRNGQPTIMGFDESLPTVIVWASDRGKFEKPPETLYLGKEICVTGMVESYEGRPAIVVKDPSQIKFMKLPDANTGADE